MKKTLILLLIATMLLALSLGAAVTAAAEEVIKVTVNGQLIEFDVPPKIINDRTMVPMRKILESLGAEVLWDEDTSKATAKTEKLTVSFYIGKTEITVIDNETQTESIVKCDVAPCVIEGRTLVPCRAISEALGLKVDWDEATSTVIITETVPEVKKQTAQATVFDAQGEEPLFVSDLIFETTVYVFGNGGTVIFSNCDFMMDVENDGIFGTKVIIDKDCTINGKLIIKNDFNDVTIDDVFSKIIVMGKDSVDCTIENCAGSFVGINTELMTVNGKPYKFGEAKVFLEADGSMKDYTGQKANTQIIGIWTEKGKQQELHIMSFEEE